MSILSFDVGMKNLAYCIVDTNGTIEDWNVEDLNNSKTSTVCENVIHHLDKHSKFQSCDTVLIEKQPSKNNQMRLIESMLHAYFIIKGKTNPESSIQKVIIYSAKNKLGNSTFKGQSNYGERKKLSIARCEYYLKETKQSQLEYFQSFKKKDDLADCLLQALAYLKKDICLRLQDVSDKYSNIVQRKPTKKQEKKGYSRSNIKYMLINNTYTNETLPESLRKSILKYYDSIVDAYQCLKIFPQSEETSKYST